MMALEGIPFIETDDDLGSIILASLEQNQLVLQPQDVLVVTSKIISKAEGRWVDLREIEPDDRALKLAALTGKDPREVAVILQQSRRISRYRQGVLIVENHLGVVCANAGVDFSNTREGDHWGLLLPEAPDASARKLRDELRASSGVEVAVIVSDSMGRPFRLGTVGFAIGVAGMTSLIDERQQPDLFKRPMQSTLIARADEIAAAAGLISGQSAEGRPVVLMRGLTYPPDENASASDLLRDADGDLYR